MPNKETKKFNKVIKARRKRVKRIANKKTQPLRKIKVNIPQQHKWVPTETKKVSWWDKIKSWVDLEK